MTDVQHTGPLRLRIFLSSPGDVVDERNLARRLLKTELPSDPLLRGQIEFDVVSWDDPASPTPMPATITPQEAVNRFGPKPSECHVVVVILWSRLGTHLDVTAFHREPGGEPYLSGTEWEFEDAWNAQPRPEIFVYQRKEEPQVGLRDPDLPEKHRQCERVGQFFKRFENPDGSIRGGWMPYTTPSDFATHLANDLKHLLRERLRRVSPKVVTVPAPVWTGSPYPGLRSFTSEEAVIFFGRGREVDALIGRLRDSDCRLLTIVGASGTGRSSLVYAGLLPRLQESAVEGSATWQIVSFQPGYQGDNPFLAVANELLRFLPQQTTMPIRLAEVLENDPATVAGYADQALIEKPTSARLVLFVDQLEELFTQVAGNYRQKFVDLLKEAARHPRVQVLVTLRADSLPQFLQLLQSPADPLQTEVKTFLLAPPGFAALTDMIRRPAQVAGVTLEDGVADKILEDAGNDPGALPLVAFCLNELYNKNAPERCITLSQYQEMGGLHEAIGKHAAAAVERTLPRERDDILEILFSKLVTIDRDGHAVRRRAPNRELDRDEAVSRLVRELSGDQGRLLTCTEATVELSHDALLDKWPMLKEWIERNRADMRLWAELKHDANNWLRPPHDNSLLWKGRKLQKARKLLKREPPYLPKNITIDDMKRFIKASKIARWKTRVYVIFAGFAFSLVCFAGIIVHFTPSLLPRKAMPVGSFNDKHPFCLYDVLGNVWEWTQDCLITENTQTGSSAQAANSYDWCLARGGSWDNHEEWKVRASYRLPLARGHRVPTVGFRVARKADDGEKSGTIVKGCKNRDDCPQMVILPDPERPFEVKAPTSETGPCEDEHPRREQPKDPVKSLAIGRYEVTVKEWNACKDCKKEALENGTNGRRPITNVSWSDAQTYVKWLSLQTGKKYRLPSGAEWEYAARGDKDTCRWWGNELDSGKANCAACGLTWEQFFDWLHLTVVSDVMSDVTSEARRIFNKLQAQHVTSH